MKKLGIIILSLLFMQLSVVFGQQEVTLYSDIYIAGNYNKNIYFYKGDILDGSIIQVDFWAKEEGKVGIENNWEYVTLKFFSEFVKLELEPNAGSNCVMVSDMYMISLSEYIDLGKNPAYKQGEEISVYGLIDVFKDLDIPKVNVKKYGPIYLPKPKKKFLSKKFIWMEKDENLLNGYYYIEDLLDYKFSRVVDTITEEDWNGLEIKSLEIQISLYGGYYYKYFTEYIFVDDIKKNILNDELWMTRDYWSRGKKERKRVLKQLINQ